MLWMKDLGTQWRLLHRAIIFPRSGPPIGFPGEFGQPERFGNAYRGNFGR